MTQGRGKTRMHDQQQAPETLWSNAAPAVASRAGLFELQQTAGNRALSEWLQSSTPLIQTKSNDGGAENAAEQQADQVAEKVTQTPAPTRSLIVDDDSQQVQPGQMRKSDFLAALRSSVSTTAEQSLKGTMWSSLGCPYIDRWFNYFNDQSGARVERALLKYAPDAASATTARDYIPIVTDRVRRGIGEWRETGQVTGLPEEFAQGGMPGATASGLLGGLLSGIGSAVSGLISGLGGALSSVGKMLFKRRDGEAREADDPQDIRKQLGTGHALDSQTRTRFQSAFGADFSSVRVHTDTRAQQLSDNLNAHAFTIGTDIAFGPAEYQPGTVVGDALIAHELAHVMQQGGSSASQPQRKENDHELDADADLSALGAMVSLAGGAVVPQTKPRRRSGLSLQRCDLFSSNKKPETPAKQTEKEKPSKPEDWDFTPEDYADLTAGKKQLRISSDSSWVPQPFQDNVLATLNYLLGPTQGERGTFGVNVRDFFHGHIVIKKDDLEERFPPVSVTDEISAYSAQERAEYTKALGSPSGKVTKENLPAFSQAVKRTLSAAAEVFKASATVKNVGVVYHTFEIPQFRPQMQSGSPRRNYFTPNATNKPEPFATPDLDSAPSYSVGPNAPFIHVFEFGFLIDRNGEVHITPGSVREFSSFTGKPVDSDTTSLK